MSCSAHFSVWRLRESQVLNGLTRPHGEIHATPRRENTPVGHTNLNTQYEDSGTDTVGRYQNSGAKTGTLDIKISARWDSSSLVSCSMLVPRLLGLEVPSLSIERF